MRQEKLLDLLQKYEEEIENGHWDIIYRNELAWNNDDCNDFTTFVEQVLHINISQKLEKLYWYMYRDRSFKEFVIPNNILAIESRVFMDCGALKTVYIPKSVRSIGEYVFDDCKDVHIYYEGSQGDWEMISKDSDWRRGTIGLRIHFNAAPPFEI